MSGDLLAIGLAVLLLAGNAFFVGAEFALISARRSQVEPRAEAGSRRARRTLQAMEQVSLMMAGAQLGITICSLGLGAVGEPAVAHLLEAPFEALGVPDAVLHPVAFAIALAVVVFLHMVLGEMVPKNLAIAGPERSVLVLAPLLLAVVTVLKPLIVALNACANGVLRLLRVQPQDEVSSTYTAPEVADLLGQSRSEGLLDPEEHELLTGALDFDARTVTQVLLKPEDLETVPPGATPEDVQRACAVTGYSRFPVADEDGTLSGYVHVKDLLVRHPDVWRAPVPPDRVRRLIALDEDSTLRDALSAMQREGGHLARVVAPDGTVRGLVALEDVLEELVGQVHDAATTT